MEPLLQLLGTQGKTADHARLGRELFERYAAPPGPYTPPLEDLPAAVRPQAPAPTFTRSRDLTADALKMFPDVDFAHFGPSLLRQLAEEGEQQHENTRDDSRALARQYVRMRATLAPLTQQIEQLRAESDKHALTALDANVAADAQAAARARGLRSLTAAQMLESIRETRVAELRDVWPLLDHEVLAQVEKLAVIRQNTPTTATSAPTSTPRASASNKRKSPPAAAASAQPRRGFSSSAASATLPPVTPVWGYVDFGMNASFSLLTFKKAQDSEFHLTSVTFTKTAITFAH